MNSSLVPLKARRVGQRCTLNLSRAETSSRWYGGVSRRAGFQLRCRPRHLTMIQITWSVAKSHRVAEQYDVNINSLTLDNDSCSSTHMSSVVFSIETELLRRDWSSFFNFEDGRNSIMCKDCVLINVTSDYIYIP
ncbi:hypothetical protein TNCV_2771891 [Trichonephila clavipes]|nr:hypothetical protein TNCV_2771891 [Trichonephila clavipes]